MGYLPRHDTQYEPRTTMSGLNCNMAAAADAARFWSLGLIDHNHQWYRDHAQNTDGSPDRIGGTNITQAHEVLDDAGVPATIYDTLDGKDMDDVVASLVAGAFLIGHGDYGSVPRVERGEIDPNFDGLHSVGFARYSTASGVLVGDGLSDAWEWWPRSVAERYLRDFPGGGFTYLVVKPRRLHAKADYANIRRTASRIYKPIGKILHDSRIHFGGTVIGESIGGNRRWYKVWNDNRIGYVHSSVAEPE